MTKELLISKELSLPLDFVVERIQFLGRADKAMSSATQEICLPADPNGIVLNADEQPAAWSRPMNKSLAEVEREHILNIFAASIDTVIQATSTVTAAASNKTIDRLYTGYVRLDKSANISNATGVGSATDSVPGAVITNSYTARDSPLEYARAA